MTKRDYILIADALLEARSTVDEEKSDGFIVTADDALRACEEAFIVMLKSDNSRFDEGKLRKYLAKEWEKR